jgi:hypothetical protein
MHLLDNGRRILQRAGIARFIVVDDRSYDLIRRMAARAEQVMLA